MKVVGLLFISMVTTIITSAIVPCFVLEEEKMQKGKTAEKYPVKQAMT